MQYIYRMVSARLCTLEKRKISLCIIDAAEYTFLDAAGLKSNSTAYEFFEGSHFFGCKRQDNFDYVG